MITVNKLYTYIPNIMGIVKANCVTVSKKDFMNAITSFITNVEHGEEAYYGSGISNEEYKELSSKENVNKLRSDVFKLIKTVKDYNNDNIYNEMLDMYNNEKIDDLIELVSPKVENKEPPSEPV